MIQAPRKSNGIELSYQVSRARAEYARAVERAVDDREPPSGEQALDAPRITVRPTSLDAEHELARLHAQLRQVREWADRAEWRETGSDGLYAILTESGIYDR